eukprot:gene26812-35502_t
MDIEGLEYDIVRPHFVFGAPRQPTEPNYEQRLAIHNKYLRRFETIQWICADSSELADKFIAWG